MDQIINLSVFYSSSETAAEQIQTDIQCVSRFIFSGSYVGHIQTLYGCVDIRFSVASFSLPLFFCLTVCNLFFILCVCVWSAGCWLTFPASLMRLQIFRLCISNQLWHSNTPTKLFQTSWTKRIISLFFILKNLLSNSSDSFKPNWTPNSRGKKCF